MLPQFGRELRTETTSFVGRRTELVKARALLGTSRVLTLTGPGGVGKTRLANKVAWHVARDFADGVRVIELETVGDPDLMAHAVAVGLGLRDLPHEPLDKVIDHLRGKSMLLVLDTCEHLVEPCGMLVGEILAAAPRVRILTTSQQVLGIEGEYLLPVPPLAVSTQEDNKTGVLPDAVTLLTHRVAAVDPQFEVGPDNRDALVAICRRLDGIPLAIELIATWFRVLLPGEILRRLDDQFRLPNGHSPTRPARQQTLAASVGWSYQLCSLAERALWVRLSVFSGGFTLDAAGRIAPSTQDDLLDLIAGLVDKSILQRDADENLARYRMLETVREYGLRKLAEGGHEAQVRRMHRDYLLGLVERFAAAWPGSGQPEIAAATCRERANLRAALDYCFDDPAEARTGAKLAILLGYYWLSCGSAGEARRWMGKVLAVDELSDAVRVEALWTSAVAAGKVGDGAASERFAVEAVRVARDTGDPYLIGVAMLAAGCAAFVLDKRDRADANFAESIELLTRSSPGGYKLMFAYAAYAMLASFAGEGDRAIDLGRTTIELAAACGEQWTCSYALYAMAFAEWRRGRLRQAAGYAARSIRIKDQFGDMAGVALLTELMAWIAASAGQGERAGRLLGVADSMWRRSGGNAALRLQNMAGAHRTCVEQVEQLLGEQGLRTALAYGRAASQSIDQAVEYVVGGRQSQVANQSPPASALLTKRELEIADLLAKGASNKQIAASLVISPRTAATHVRNILEKLGFTSRVQIAGRRAHPSESL